jgi:hypothetical protein
MKLDINIVADPGVVTIVIVVSTLIFFLSLVGIAAFVSC